MGETASEKRDQRPVQPVDVVLAASVGVVLGAVLYGLSSVVGPRLPEGWTDLLQGGSIFAGVIVALLGIRRCTARALGRS